MLATAYLKLSRFAQAQRAFEVSLRTAPPSRRRLFGLAEAMRNQNKLEEAIPLYEQALVLSPGWDLAHRGLATVYSQMRRYSEAEGHWRRCVESKPTSAYYLTNLGSTLFARRRPAEAVPVLRKALQQDAENEYAYRSLWQSLLALGRRAEAIGVLQAGQQALPGARSITCPLAWLLATTPQRTSVEIRDAVQWAKECCEAGSAHPRDFDTLGAAYAANGEFSKAAEAARRAISMAAARGQPGLQRQIEARLQLYEAGRPYLEPRRHTP